MSDKFVFIILFLTQKVRKRYCSITSMKVALTEDKREKCFLLKRVNWELSMMYLIYKKEKVFVLMKIKKKCFINNFWVMPWKWSTCEVASIILNKKLLTLLTTRISPFNVCREFVLAKSSKKRFWCNAKYCWISYPKSKLSVIQTK